MNCKHNNKSTGVALVNTWAHVPRNHCQGPHNAKAEMAIVNKCEDCGKSWRKEDR
jgi:hypothetical protein